LMGSGDIDLTGIRKTGEVIFVEVGLSVIKTGGTTLATAFITDITERKRMEVALQESEDKFRSVLETAPIGLVIIDEAGKIVSVNQKTEQLFGYERDELLGQKIEMLLPHSLRGGHVALRQGYLANPKPRLMGSGDIDLTGIRKTGEVIFVEVGLSVIKTDT